MLVYKNGDILKATENIICQQVNVDGIMGGGLAYQIANKYPSVNEEYIKYCEKFHNSEEWLLGHCCIVPINKNQYIANCFSQRKNFDTDYKAIRDIFARLCSVCERANKTIAIPFHYGSGIANGNWEEIITIIKNLSDKYDVSVSVYILEE